MNVKKTHITRNVLQMGNHHDFFLEITSVRKTQPIQVYLEGLGETISGRLNGDSLNHFFQKQEWIARFYRHHRLRAGDILAVEKTNRGCFRLYPFETRRERNSDWQNISDAPPKGRGPTVIELFAGCGGLLWGFQQAGFRTMLANEWDAAACDTIRRNLTDRVAQCAVEEIKTFPKADVVVGGPPCQGFSNLGERMPDDPRRQMWRHFLQAVRDSGAQAFVMENVPPLLSSQEYMEIRRIAGDLGYEVLGKVLNTADYGVPQTRKRAIVIGLRGRVPTFPSPTHVEPAKLNLFNHSLPPWRTVRDAIGDLPAEPNDHNWHIGRNPTDVSKERYAYIPPGGNRFDLPWRLTPECWRKKTKGGTDLFGRLWWDRPSVTIRTEFYKPEKGRYLHPKEDRPITHREAARLQGFPDDFVFCGSKIQVGLQIGNAVPLPLAKALAKHVAGLLRSVHPSQ